MFGKFTIGAKLAMGFSLKALLIVVLTSFAIVQIDRLGEAIEKIFEHPFTVTREIGSAWSGINKIELLLYEAILDKNTDLGRIDNEIEALGPAIMQHFKLARERYLGDRTEFDEAIAAYNAWIGLHDEILDLARAGKRDQALEKMSVSSRGLAKVEIAYTMTRDFAYRRAGAFFQEARDLASRSIGLLLALCGVALAVAATVSYLIVSSVRSSLGLAVGAAKRLSQGELDLQITEVRFDETGQLLAAMNEAAASTRSLAKTAEAIAGGDLSVAVQPRSEHDALAQSMSRMHESLSLTAKTAETIAAGDLRHDFTPRSERDVLGRAFSSMVTNLRGETSQIMEAVSLLASSAGQILSSTNNLASLAAETATAVAQTTATMEEVKQTAMLAADRAGDVAGSAQQAVDVSENGQDRLERTFEGLARIKEQMASIAASILSLTEKSQAVGEIILTVGDLAEQSNILAVNAAIEATKAGEHGRGFSVLAEEIRNLADQSRQATNQIRSMLGDMQRATSAVVMTAEQGDKAVDATLRLSAEAKSSLATLSGAISGSAQAAAQIAASSQEQLSGTDQVVLAMESIREASSQQAQSARQLDSAAKDLTELGQRLKTLLNRYKV
ncbi:MAG: HAMP domain-containing protein [Desulfovibrionaceae bacterium]|nr:HAMP domain-containing protein [Desulfovibrionaceae bacterium]MBF0514613.1 HAMP domain-containing protein [Desulfovibrionaceae bacterium]